MARDFPQVTPAQAMRTHGALQERAAGSRKLTLRLALEALTQVAGQEREDVTLGHAEAVALLGHLRALELAASPSPSPPTPDPALVAELRQLVTRGQELLQRFT